MLFRVSLSLVLLVVSADIWSQYVASGTYHFRTSIISPGNITVQTAEKGKFIRYFDAPNHRFRIDGTNPTLHQLSTPNRPLIPFILIGTDNTVNLISATLESTPECWTFQVPWSDDHPLTNAHPGKIELTQDARLVRPWWNASLPETCAARRFPCAVGESIVALDMFDGGPRYIQFAGRVKRGAVEIGFWTWVEIEVFHSDNISFADEMFTIPEGIRCHDAPKP
jgi:hypothetical protein